MRCCNPWAGDVRNHFDSGMLSHQLAYLQPFGYTSTPDWIRLDVVHAFVLQKRLDLPACVPVLTTCNCYSCLLLDPIITIQVLRTNGFFDPKRLVWSNGLTQFHRVIHICVVPDTVVVEHELRVRQLFPQDAYQFDVLFPESD